MSEHTDHAGHADHSDHVDHTDCSETLHRVYEYLDGEMTMDDTHRIAQHLHECAPCFEQYNLDKALKALVKRSCQCEEAPVALRTQIMARITTIRLQTSSD